MKTSWAEKLRDVDWPAYRQMRARIWLRKTNQNLTEESIEAATEQNNGVVSSDDTLQALEHGDEVRVLLGLGDVISHRMMWQQIDIVQVVCIKYDHDFAEDMESRFNAWDSTRIGEQKGKATERAKKNKRGKPMDKQTKSGLVLAEEPASEYEDHTNDVG